MNAKPNPWIRHTGTDQPPTATAPIELRLRTGATAVSKRPEREDWGWLGVADDILYWRGL